MARRHIHYEAAFEDYLRSQGRPYVAVDETRKAIFAGSRVKSFDFVVYHASGSNWLVEVKGRKFPYDTPGNRRMWENWVSEEDLEALSEWERVFGGGFEAMLVFAYCITSWSAELPGDALHPFRGEYYAFMAVSLSNYKSHAVRRSLKWGTVTVPTRAFKTLALAM